MYTKLRRDLQIQQVFCVKAYFLFDMISLWVNLIQQLYSISFVVA